MMSDVQDRRPKNFAANIVLFWTITSFVMFWFLLEGSAYMAGIALVIQAIGIVFLYRFGAPQILKVSAGRLASITAIGFFLVFVGHWLANNHQKIIF